jgi:hypothetical protein
MRQASFRAELLSAGHFRPEIRGRNAGMASDYRSVDFSQIRHRANARAGPKIRKTSPLARWARESRARNRGAISNLAQS